MMHIAYYFIGDFLFLLSLLVLNRRFKRITKKSFERDFNDPAVGPAMFFGILLWPIMLFVFVILACVYVFRKLLPD